MARPRKAEGQVKIQLNASVLPDVYQAVEGIALAQWRTKSQVAEKLLLRGLAAYYRDGLLDESTGAPIRPFLEVPERKTKSKKS